MTKRLSPHDFARLLAIKPGLMVDVQITLDEVPLRFKTEFIGHDSKEIIIIKLPAKVVNEHESALKKGSLGVICRFVLDEVNGEVVAFESQSCFLLSKPFSHIYVAFPDHIQLHSLRSARRAATRIAVQVRSLTHHKSWSALMVDLSWTGCRLALPLQLSRPMSIGDEMAITFDHIEGRALNAQICNIKKTPDEQLFGLKFTDEHDTISAIVNEMFIAL